MLGYGMGVFATMVKMVNIALAITRFLSRSFKICECTRSCIFWRMDNLAALIYYDWTARPRAKDTFSVFRCGGLTDAGKLALQPM